MSDHTLIPKGHNALGSKRSFLLFILLISILSVSWELTTVLGDMDEIRNFNLSRGIVMGYVPYRDFNMVMTPLFNLLFAIPLIFSKTLIVYRVTSALMWIATYICFYKLCTHYFDNRAATLLCVSSILLSTQFTYNSLVFLFAILMLLILTNEESYKNAFLIGLLGILAALSRQTSGTFLLILGFFFVLKKSKSNKAKHLVSYFAGIGSIGIPFLFYLLFTGSFIQFWDYCLFALFLPGGNGSVVDDYALPAIIISLAGIGMDIYYYVKHKEPDRIYHLLIGLSLSTIAIPRVDFMHVTFMGMWFIMPIIEFACSLTKRNAVYVLVTLTTVFISLTILITGYFRTKEAIFSDEFKAFRFIPMTENIAYGYATVASQNKLYEVSGYHVTSIIHEAALISIMNEEFNPPFDLFLNGNLGTNDPIYYLEEACNKDHAIILCSDELGWQMPDGIREYIEEHCEPIATYAQFTWYIPTDDNTQSTLATISR